MTHTGASAATAGGPYTLVCRIKPMTSVEQFERDPVLRAMHEGKTKSEAFEAMRAHDPRVIWTPHVVECNALLDHLLRNYPEWLHWLPMKFPDDPEAPLGLGQYVGKTAIEHQKAMALHHYDANGIGVATKHLEALGAMGHHGRDHGPTSTAIDKVTAALKPVIKQAMREHFAQQKAAEAEIESMPAHYTVYEPQLMYGLDLRPKGHGKYHAAIGDAELLLELIDTPHGVPALTMTTHRGGSVPDKRVMAAEAKYAPETVLVFKGGGGNEVFKLAPAEKPTEPAPLTSTASTTKRTVPTAPPAPTSNPFYYSGSAQPRAARRQYGFAFTD